MPNYGVINLDTKRNLEFSQWLAGEEKGEFQQHFCKCSFDSTMFL